MRYAVRQHRVPKGTARPPQGSAWLRETQGLHKAVRVFLSSAPCPKSLALYQWEYSLWSPPSRACTLEASQTDWGSESLFLSSCARFGVTVLRGCSPEELLSSQPPLLDQGLRAPFQKHLPGVPDSRPVMGDISHSRGTPETRTILTACASAFSY